MEDTNLNLLTQKVAFGIQAALELGSLTKQSPRFVDWAEDWLNDKDRSQETAEKLYADLTAAGFEVLYDDRSERAGVKLNDADLTGVPLRIAIGDKSLAKGQVELKLRNESNFEAFNLDQIVEKTREFLNRAI